MTLKSGVSRAIDVCSKERFSLKGWDRLKFYSPAEESNESCNSSDDGTASISWSSSSSNSEDGANRTQNFHKISRHIVTRLNFDNCVIQRHKTPRQKRARVNRFVTNYNMNNTQNIIDITLPNPALQTQNVNGSPKDSKINKSTSIKNQNCSDVSGDSAEVFRMLTHSPTRSCETVPMLTDINNSRLCMEIPPESMDVVSCVSACNLEHNFVTDSNNDIDSEGVYGHKTPPKSHQQQTNHTVSSPVIGSNKKYRPVSKRKSVQEETNSSAASPIIGSSKKHTYISPSPIIGSTSSSVRRRVSWRNAKSRNCSSSCPIENNLPSTSPTSSLHISPSPIFGSCKKPTHIKPSSSIRRQVSRSKAKSKNGNSSCPIETDISSASTDMGRKTRCEQNIIPSRPISCEPHIETKRSSVGAPSFLRTEWELNNIGITGTDTCQNVIVSGTNTVPPSLIPLSPVLVQKSVTKVKKKIKNKKYANGHVEKKSTDSVLDSKVELRDSLCLDYMYQREPFTILYSKGQICSSDLLLPEQFDKSSSNICNKENEQLLRVDVQKSVSLNDIYNKNADSKYATDIIGKNNVDRKLDLHVTASSISEGNNFKQNAMLTNYSWVMENQFKIPSSMKVGHSKETISVLKKNDGNESKSSKDAVSVLKNDIDTQSKKINILTDKIIPNTQESEILHISFETQTLHVGINEAKVPHVMLEENRELSDVGSISFFIQDEPSTICSLEIEDALPKRESVVQPDDSHLVSETNKSNGAGKVEKLCERVVLRNVSPPPSIESISSQEIVPEQRVEEKLLTQRSNSSGSRNISQQASPSRSSSCETVDAISSANASQQESVKLELQSPPRIHRPLFNMDSAKKKRKRIKKDGLAGRLQRLLNRQQSTANVWEHELRNAKHGSPRGSLFIVRKVWVECARILILCSPYSERPIQQEQQDTQGVTDQQNGSEDQELCSPDTGVEELGSTWIVVLDPDVVPLAQLKCESAIRLYPPWQTMRVERLNLSLILSVTHAVLVSAGSFAKTAPQPAEVSSLQQFTCSCLQGHAVQQNCGFALPRQGLDLLELLFPLRRMAHGGKSPADCQLLDVGGETLEQIGTVAEAVTKHNHALVGNIWVQLRVLRIFCSSQPGTASSSQVDRARAKDPSCSLTWSVLGKDSTGESCEVILGSPPSDCVEEDGVSGEWSKILTGPAVGSTYKFTGLTVIKKISGNAAAGLLDVERSPKEGENRSTPQLFLYVLSVASKTWEMTCIKTPDCSMPPKFQPLTEVLKQVEMPGCTRHSVLVKLLAIVDSFLYFTDTSLCAADPSSGTPSYVTVNVKPSCFIPLKVSARRANIVCLQDLQLYKGQLHADKYSRILVATDSSSKASRQMFTTPLDEVLYLSTFSLQPSLQQLQSSSTVRDLITITGRVVQVDEETAYAWPSCARCANDLLCELDENMFLCQNCDGMAQVYTKMSLEVFISCPTLPVHCQVRVKLQQDSIASLLPPTQNDGKGYEMSSVLNKVVGPLHCVVLKAKTTNSGGDEEPSMYFTVEEIPSWEDKFQLQLQEINKMFNEDWNEVIMP